MPPLTPSRILAMELFYSRLQVLASTAGKLADGCHRVHQEGLGASQARTQRAQRAGRLEIPLISNRYVSGRGRSMTPLIAPPGLPVVVLDLPGGYFLECDREVVLGGGLDHGRREFLEGSLAQVVVVAVDLTGTLGGHEDARIVGVDIVEQAIDTG